MHVNVCPLKHATKCTHCAAIYLWHTYISCIHKHWLFRFHQQQKNQFFFLKWTHVVEEIIHTIIKIIVLNERDNNGFLKARRTKTLHTWHEHMNMYTTMRVRTLVPHRKYHLNFVLHHHRRCEWNHCFLQRVL